MSQNYFETATFPLYAAEFDYFRIPREKWELMMTRLNQLGANALFITMPWGFHEFSEGTVDLNGATSARRDVIRLFELCARLDLPCLLSLGPYSNSGVLNDGLPLWLSADGPEFETSLTHGVEGWYRAASKALAGQQWPAGPIIALQIDSEPKAQTEPNLSKQLTEVKWRIWLRKHYEGIEALNEAHGTTYRTVNDVKFPSDWSQDDSPLAKDAREFLAKVQQDTETHYTQILTDAGWQVPIYPSARELHPELPLLETQVLAGSIEWTEDRQAPGVVTLQQPIQVDPEPVEVGRRPMWAGQAPVRPDGSIQQKFWAIRHKLWSTTLTTLDKGHALTVDCDPVKLVSSREAAALKLPLGAAPKAKIFRLRLSGELVEEDHLTLKQGKLQGSYLAEDEVGQTDLIVVANPGLPLSDFPLAYLRPLLITQVQSLARAAGLAQTLGDLLAVSLPAAEETAPERPKYTLDTLEEARRGLKEADAALRKAITSISGLENGMATILDRPAADLIPQPAPTAAGLTPDLFDAPVREVLVGIGTTCTEIGTDLKVAATSGQALIDAPDGFSLEEYRAAYQRAVEAARAAQTPLLKVIAELRRQIGADELPYVLWRIHDQVQEIVETLRWGVLRG